MVTVINKAPLETQSVQQHLSTPKMARTKHTARKGMDGAARRITKASRNIAVKAPCKPPS